MGLPEGCVTDPERGLTPNQAVTALGNGVLPLQAFPTSDSVRSDVSLSVLGRQRQTRARS